MFLGVDLDVSGFLVYVLFWGVFCVVWGWMLGWVGIIRIMLSIGLI